eukprot:9248331-Pyramimonas_sp.AAC.1
MARSNWSPRCVPTVLAPTAGLESGDSFTDRSPQEWLGLVSVFGVYPLRWAPQQVSKVATISQIAAPQGWRGPI